jgi:protein-S-isoprenylcysteine O-methyltransferase Ste14
MSAQTTSTTVSPVLLSTQCRDEPTLLARIATLAYGLVAYVSFLGAFLYAMGFVGRWIVPKNVDTVVGGVTRPVLTSLAINAALLSVFVLQHTFMARPGFKRWFTRIIPRSIERSTYVLAASASLALVFWLWQPAPMILWSVDQTWLAWLIDGVGLSGWIIALFASFMVSHADLFGLRQTWLRFINREYQPVGFRLVGLYKLVRHPLMLGFLIAIWATPVMSVGHLFFTIMVSGYIAMGVWFEERDLMAEHGKEYGEYRRRVRAVIPLPRSSV